MVCFLVYDTRGTSSLCWQSFAATAPSGMQMEHFKHEHKRIKLERSHSDTNAMSVNMQLVRCAFPTFAVAVGQIIQAGLAARALLR